MNEKEKQEFQRRQKNQLSKNEREQAALAHLKQRLVEAKALSKFGDKKSQTNLGDKNAALFLRIDYPWNVNERILFETGVNGYRGESRKLYCNATGKAFVFAPFQIEKGQNIPIFISIFICILKEFCLLSFCVFAVLCFGLVC